MWRHKNVCYIKQEKISGNKLKINNLPDKKFKVMFIQTLAESEEWMNLELQQRGRKHKKEQIRNEEYN